MIINTLDITNFRCIRSASFAFHKRLNVFAGANGTGKSTVLECLSVLLSRVASRIVTGSGGRNFTENDISTGSNTTECSLSVTQNDQKYIWTLRKSNQVNKASPPQGDLADARRLADEVRTSLDADSRSGVPLAVFYATNRAVVQVPLKVKKQHSFDQLAALGDALLSERKNADFRLFFEWFRNREDVENESYRSCQQDGITPKPDVLLQAVRLAVERMMPGYTGLRVKRRPKLCMVVKKGSEEFRIEALSDGEKCLLALVADMARRLAMANPSMADPLEAEAIFLIDEIDLHLHPLWQKKVVPGLLDVFPNCQFFISTHSPLVLGEIRNMESVWLMKPGEKPFHPLRVFGLDANEVLGEVMNAECRSDDVQAALEQIDSLIQDDAIDEARDAIRELTRKTGIIPAVIEANSMLTMIGEEGAFLDDLVDEAELDHMEKMFDSGCRSPKCCP